MNINSMKTRRIWNCLVFVFLLLALYFPSGQAQYGDEYPMKSLQCYSYLTKPDMKLICPASRNKYCVKEVSTLTQDICGATQYFGDMYVNKQCVFKKCNATCTPGTYTFSYQGITYSRTTYCCKTDLCNAGSRSGHSSSLWFAVTVSILVSLVTWFTAN